MPPDETEPLSVQG